MFEAIKRYFAKRAMQKRIGALTEAERRDILSKSLLEAAAFQGEGYHVFRRDIEDVYQAYVCTLGEISPDMAEDWIIEQDLLEQDQAR